MPLVCTNYLHTNSLCIILQHNSIRSHKFYLLSKQFLQFQTDFNRKALNTSHGLSEEAGVDYYHV